MSDGESTFSYPTSPSVIVESSPIAKHNLRVWLGISPSPPNYHDFTPTPPPHPQSPLRRPIPETFDINDYSGESLPPFPFTDLARLMGIPASYANAVIHQAHHGQLEPTDSYVATQPADDTSSEASVEPKDELVEGQIPAAVDAQAVNVNPLEGHVDSPVPTISVADELESSSAESIHESESDRAESIDSDVVEVIGDNSDPITSSNEIVTSREMGTHKRRRTSDDEGSGSQGSSTKKKKSSVSFRFKAEGANISVNINCTSD